MKPRSVAKLRNLLHSVTFCERQLQIFTLLSSTVHVNGQSDVFGKGNFSRPKPSWGKVFRSFQWNPLLAYEAPWNSLWLWKRISVIGTKLRWTPSPTRKQSQWWLTARNLRSSSHTLWGNGKTHLLHQIVCIIAQQDVHLSAQSRKNSFTVLKIVRFSNSLNLEILFLTWFQKINCTVIS